MSLELRAVTKICSYRTDIDIDVQRLVGYSTAVDLCLSNC